jgi:hypothetical protein
MILQIMFTIKKTLTRVDKEHLDLRALLDPLDSQAHLVNPAKMDLTVYLENKVPRDLWVALVYLAFQVPKVHLDPNRKRESLVYTFGKMILFPNLVRFPT